MCETDDITFMTNAQNSLDLLTQALESTVHRVQVVQPPFECDMAKIETSCVLGDGAVEAEEVKSKARQMRMKRWKPNPNATISEDGKTVTKTGGGNNWNCCVQTAVPLLLQVADAVCEYSVRIVKSTNSCIMIGLATDEVNSTGKN